MMEEMTRDYYTNHVYEKLWPVVEKIAYKDMQLSSLDMNDEDLEFLTYQMCEGPLVNHFNFWPYASVLNQMQNNADWEDIQLTVKNTIEKYVEGIL